MARGIPRIAGRMLQTCLLGLWQLARLLLLLQLLGTSLLLQDAAGLPRGLVKSFGVRGTYKDETLDQILPSESVVVCLCVCVCVSFMSVIWELALVIQCQDCGFARPILALPAVTIKTSPVRERSMVLCG